jgi:hypothetical protein
MIHAARHHHDVISDGLQRHKLLDSADLESVSRGTYFGLDDLQVGTTGLLGCADAQHRLASDGLLADVLQIIRPAESAQDRDR